MKKFLLLLILLLPVNLLFANNDEGIEKDRFVVNYNVVNDVTTITDKWDTGRGIPGMGDKITGQSLCFEFSIQFPGKFYDPKDPDLKMTLIFVEMYFNDNYLKRNLYEPGDMVVLMADDTRFRLGAAKYAVAEYGDAIVGRHPMEVLGVPITPDILGSMGNAKKLMGVINAQNADAAKPFTFDKTDNAYINRLLDVLNALQKPAAAK
jgi:hypothetical protein